MEFLTQSLASAHLYYANINENLAKIIGETKLCLLSATLDLAIDLEHKMHHQIDKNHLIKKVIQNLDIASKNLRYFPAENKISNFDEVEIEILMICDFAKEYAVHGYEIVAGFSLVEKKMLSDKILIIKSRRII